MYFVPNWSKEKAPRLQTLQSLHCHTFTEQLIGDLNFVRDWHLLSWTATTLKVLCFSKFATEQKATTRYFCWGSWHKFCQHHHFDVPACWMLAYVVKPESLPLLLNCLRVEVSSRETQYCSSSVFELPLLDSKLIVVFATFTELFRQMWRRFRDGFQHRGWDQHSTGWEPSCVSPFNIWDNMECCQSVQVRNQSTP